ncbi:hypothetical protein EC9_46100 [Rosistilla ulvae]|uniref:Uncharacterized protein n=1 Tax=Rosistilla ulvae TaxID=1930277 RepID=A0A517M693_9BACT|nr:hypothetical protein EC9_46100 [Rosistilla ulvae]
MLTGLTFISGTAMITITGITMDKWTDALPARNPLRMR